MIKSDETIHSANSGESIPIAQSKCMMGGEENETSSAGRIVVPVGALTVVSASVGKNFARLLPHSQLVECVAWAWEGQVLRIWTILARRDRDVQRQIYSAESQFIEALSDRRCDFSIIFREGRDLRDVLPSKTNLLSFAD